MCITDNVQCSELNAALSVVEEVTDEVEVDDIRDDQIEQIRGSESEVHRLVYDEGDEWKSAVAIDLLNNTIEVISFIICKFVVEFN